MPKIRWITCSGQQWRISKLAKLHHISVGTLSHRINNGIPIEAALTVPIMQRQEIGRIGKDSKASLLWPARKKNT